MEDPQSHIVTRKNKINSMFSASVHEFYSSSPFGEGSGSGMHGTIGVAGIHTHEQTKAEVATTKTEFVKNKLQEVLKYNTDVLIERGRDQQKGPLYRKVLREHMEKADRRKNMSKYMRSSETKGYEFYSGLENFSKTEEPKFTGNPRAGFSDSKRNPPKHLTKSYDSALVTEKHRKVYSDRVIESNSNSIADRNSGVSRTDHIVGTKGSNQLLSNSVLLTQPERDPFAFGTVYYLNKTNQGSAKDGYRDRSLGARVQSDKAPLDSELWTIEALKFVHEIRFCYFSNIKSGHQIRNEKFKKRQLVSFNNHKDGKSYAPLATLSKRDIIKQLFVETRKVKYIEGVKKNDLDLLGEIKQKLDATQSKIFNTIGEFKKLIQVDAQGKLNRRAAFKPYVNQSSGAMLHISHDTLVDVAIENQRQMSSNIEKLARSRHDSLLLEDSMIQPMQLIKSLDTREPESMSSLINLMGNRSKGEDQSGARDSTQLGFDEFSRTTGMGTGKRTFVHTKPPSRSSRTPFVKLLGMSEFQVKDVASRHY